MGARKKAMKATITDPDFIRHPADFRRVLVSEIQSKLMKAKLSICV